MIGLGTAVRANSTRPVAGTRLAAAMFMALGLFAGGCWLHPNHIEEMRVEVDARAIPGWIFVEIRDDCPASRGRWPWSKRTYIVDQDGLGCTSTDVPEHQFMALMMMRDPATGKAERYRGPLLGSAFGKHTEVRCGDTVRQRWIWGFVGGKDDRAGAGSILDAQRSTGLFNGLPDGCVPRVVEGWADGSL